MCRRSAWLEPADGLPLGSVSQRSACGYIQVALQRRLFCWLYLAKNRNCQQAIRDRKTCPNDKQRPLRQKLPALGDAVYLSNEALICRIKLLYPTDSNPRFTRNAGPPILEDCPLWPLEPHWPAQNWSWLLSNFRQSPKYNSWQ